MKSLLLTVILLISPVVILGSSAASDYILYSYDLSSTKADGVIDPNEYATYFDQPTAVGSPSTITIYWGHNGTHLAVAIEGAFTGWVGFGMNTPGNGIGGMAGADMIIASVDDTGLTIADYSAAGNTNPTIDDNQMDITAGGKDDGSKTTIEFIIPMKSSDSAGKDHNWVEGGTYTFFVAFHATNDDLTYHTGRTDILTVEVAGPSVPLPADRKVSITQESVDYTEQILGFVMVAGFFAFIIVMTRRNAKLT